ncbi:MAG TPA: cyclic nucleotide-binding domain-containing protein [Candidatus Micrarchaeaceae archaeon]|nr:cyclic nucleotide-binding domain-containing protein [Candidatus Micrarchaeaceae archaeon]
MSDTQRIGGGSPDDLRKRFQILERVAIFFTLPDNILHALARRLAPASATKGSVIVHQGDPGDTMFVVESGRCEVFVEESPGHTITIALMGPDDFFGEMALISEETRTASVRALEDCQLLTLDRKTLYETLPADSDAIIELTKLVEQRKDTLPNLIARARMVAPEQAASTVAVYSPKGGSGRTTVAVNLAAALGKRFPGEVLLVDLALPYNHAALISYLTPTGCLAAASQVPPANFEEAVLGAILHHPGGMMLLPGVLRAEQADLITVDLVNRAMGILVNAFRYIVFDLGVAFTDIVISVLDHSQRVLVLVTPELSSLKDVGELLNIFTNVLNIVPGRVILALNNKVPKSVVSKEDVVRTLKQELAVEIDFDGTKPDEAAVKGEILVLTDPKSAISRGAEQLAQLISGQTAVESKGAKRGFKLGKS